MSLYSWENTKHESLLRMSVLVGIGIGEDWGPHREHLPRRLLTETCAPCSLQDNHSPVKSSPNSGSPTGTLLYVESVPSCQMLSSSSLPNALRFPQERTFRTYNSDLSPVPSHPQRWQYLYYGITQCPVDVGNHSHVQNTSGNTSCQCFCSAQS